MFNVIMDTDTNAHVHSIHTHMHVRAHKFTHIYTHKRMHANAHTLELGDLMILLFIVTLKCHDKST